MVLAKVERVWWRNVSVLRWSTEQIKPGLCREKMRITLFRVMCLLMVARCCFSIRYSTQSISNSCCLIFLSRVLRSTLTLEEDGSAISGAKLVDNRQVAVTDVTFCIRFNFKLLGGFEGRSQLIHIEDWRDRPKDSDFNMMWFAASYPNTFFGFGHPRVKGSYKSMFVRDPSRSGFEVWETNRWSHVCFSYEKKNGYIRMVKDGR